MKYLQCFLLLILSTIGQIPPMNAKINQYIDNNRIDYYIGNDYVDNRLRNDRKTHVIDLLIVYDYAFINKYFNRFNGFESKVFRDAQSDIINGARLLLKGVNIELVAHAAISWEEKAIENLNKSYMLSNFKKKSINYQQKAVYDLKILISGYDYQQIEPKHDIIYESQSSPEFKCNSHVIIFDDHNLPSLIVKAIALKVSTKYDDDTPNCANCGECVMSKKIITAKKWSNCSHEHLHSFLSQKEANFSICKGVKWPSSQDFAICGDYEASGEEECDCLSSDSIETCQQYCDLSNCRFSFLNDDVEIYQPPSVPHHPLLLWPCIVSFPFSFLSIYYAYRRIKTTEALLIAQESSTRSN